MLFFLSLTEDSLPENSENCKHFFHFISLFFLGVSGRKRAKLQGVGVLIGGVGVINPTPFCQFRGGRICVKRPGVVFFNIETKTKQNKNSLNKKNRRLHLKVDVDYR
jgi:hypothetical protein